MKKAVIFVISLLFICYHSRGQQSTFPTDGSNVGIGTLSPLSNLHITGSGNPASLLLGVNPSSGSYTALLATLSSVTGGYASLQSISASGSAFGNIVLNSSGGNVGVGTSYPNQRLDVNGNIRINQLSSLYFDSSNGSFIRQNGTGAFDITASSAIGNGNITLNPSPTGSLYLNFASGNGIYLGNGAAQSTGIINNAGNIGLGTLSPAAPLDIGKSLNAGDLSAVLARLPEGNTAGGGTYLGIKGYNTQETPGVTSATNVKSFAIEHSFYGLTNSSINFFRGGDVTGGSIGFNTNDNTEKMRILYNGYVGIGTTSPDQMLTVNGTIHAKQINVDTQIPFPDFVFNRTYKLRTLADVNRYITLNKHLPEIPSAKTIEKTGINVSALNMKLLQKVEELTLYLIEKDKQIKDQNEHMANLEKRLEALEKKQ